jgi:hypothetical protein
MIYESLLLALVIAVVIMIHPEFFSWFFTHIKTKYLRPEVSIFELLIIGIIIYILVLIYPGE